MRQSWQPDLKLLKKISYDNRLQKKKEKDQTKRKKKRQQNWNEGTDAGSLRS